MGERKRKPISKKMRFEVFKRDGFKCAYCGQSPPSVTLEVDHVDPYSKGGECTLSNYLTACFDCNRGKRDIPLTDKIPSQLSENLEAMKEKESQIKEYRKFVEEVRARVASDIDDIANIFATAFEDSFLTEKFKMVSIKRFLDKLPKHEVAEAMKIAVTRMAHDQDAAGRYFCGICWNKINGGGK